MIVSEEDARQFCTQRAGPRAIELLERFAQLLAEENTRQNLVSASSLTAIWQRHFADSLQLLDHVPRGTRPWLDLGSGAGFPGVALAIARPDVEMVLVESRKRRTEWLSSLAVDLGLPNCRIVASQLEAVVTFPAAVITARAFAPLEKLLGLSARFSTPATVWLLPKGRSAAQELAEQPAGVQAMFHVEQSITDPAGGILVGRGAPDLS